MEPYGDLAACGATVIEGVHQILQQRGAFHGVLRVQRVRFRGTEDCHDAIPDVLVDLPVASANQWGDVPKVFIHESTEFICGQVVRQGREPDHVGKHDAGYDLAPTGRRLGGVA